MGSCLLQHPLIHFYLLYVAALFAALVWDYWRNPAAYRDDSRTPRDEVAYGAPGQGVEPIRDGRPDFQQQEGVS